MIPKTFFLIALAFLFCASAEAKIAGDYLESRSADVYTGQCFANGEVGYDGIGILTRRIAGKVFVLGILAGLPAERCPASTRAPRATGRLRVHSAPSHTPGCRRRG